MKLISSFLWLGQIGSHNRDSAERHQGAALLYLPIGTEFLGGAGPGPFTCTANFDQLCKTYFMVGEVDALSRGKIGFCCLRYSPAQSFLRHDLLLISPDHLSSSPCLPRQLGQVARNCERQQDVGFSRTQGTSLVGPTAVRHFESGLWNKFLDLAGKAKPFIPGR